MVSVPESALEFEGEDAYVYTKSQDGTYQKTKITTGLSDGVNIEVKDGLNEGDTVRGPRIIEDENTDETAQTDQAASEEAMENNE